MRGWIELAAADALLDRKSDRENKIELGPEFPVIELEH